MNHFRVLVFILFFTFSGPHLTWGQKSLENQISDSLTSIVNKYSFVGKVAISTLIINDKNEKILIRANDRLSYIPFREENVQQIYRAIRSVLPSKYSSYDISCQTDSKSIEELIPNFFRSTVSDELRKFKTFASSPPLVSSISRLFGISSGLQNRHIALWQSHGWHYDQKDRRWEWQRARILETVEDLYTQSYVLPYLLPMLENAGATVLLPRERDTQLKEIIVDNDTKNDESKYKEHNDRNSWKRGDSCGFGHTKKFYLQGENPFCLGSYRKNYTVSDETETSSAEWFPHFSESGRYAVYVSYKTEPNSVTDARYTVYHQGVKTNFSVNQTMNGGTWLYLGHFYFEKGKLSQNKIVLTNWSSQDDKIVTADAVKIGGGMGNIARSPQIKTIVQKDRPLASSDTMRIKLENVYTPEVSKYPRFAEGARYWLQWAGAPDSVYSYNKGANDYTDDFQSRGLWVNYLIGGSVLAPDLKGLGIPIDMALAFHTDAGMTKNDSIIGTLGIFSVPNSDKKTIYRNGVSRWAARDLTDIVQTQVVNDIQKQFSPEWTRRNLWNKSYSESRVPEVPTMIMELLSHQNFADMRYGHDPRFKFAVGRAVYKGILKYLNSANGTDYVIQPLPIHQFSCHFKEKQKIELKWLPTFDSLETTANAERYVVYTKIDEGSFDNGIVVNNPSYIQNIQVGKIYSYKITAINKGGESFDSETLSAYRAPNEKGEVLIINGFDRISAPGNFSIDSTYAGFLSEEEPGVPYISDISYTGKQYEFNRNEPWLDDDAPGFGASYANYETKEIAGNTFDYPYLHGQAIKPHGYSFVSCSLQSIIKGDIEMTDFKIVDLILGKQKQTCIGNAKKTPEFKTFPLALQQKIKMFCDKGGCLFLSGSFIASDACQGPDSQPQDKKFIENVLKYKLRTGKGSLGGKVKIVNSPYADFKKLEIDYYNEPNEISYFVNAPDAIETNDINGYTICRYAENNFSAGIAYAGNYKICAMGFPFETIQSEKDRIKLMDNILLFFSSL